MKHSRGKEQAFTFGSIILTSKAAAAFTYTYSLFREKEYPFWEGDKVDSGHLQHFASVPFEVLEKLLFSRLSWFSLFPRHHLTWPTSRLFATVDPRLRSVVLPSGRKVLLSDTVGFISDLPVQLVEAFHTTLEEVVEADLLVHVLDSSVSNFEEQRSTVLQVLG